MGKNKPRHNPDKPQNKTGGECYYYEGYDGNYWCERGYNTTKCKERLYLISFVPEYYSIRKSVRCFSIFQCSMYRPASLPWN